jgi:cytidine deaminase
MNNCPCCTDKLLRHVRNQDLYWFCLRCRQEMPNFNLIQMEMVAIKNENNQYYDKSQIKSLITACPSKICPKYRSG